jgi:hypothetical protein
MDFDFKVTTWERVTVDQEDEEKVLEAIKNGTVTSSNDIFDLLYDSGNISCEILDDTTNKMTIEENGGVSTIEIIDDNGQTIFTNAAER